MLTKYNDVYLLKQQMLLLSTHFDISLIHNRCIYFLSSIYILWLLFFNKFFIWNFQLAFGNSNLCQTLQLWKSILCLIINGSQLVLKFRICFIHTFAMTKIESGIQVDQTVLSSCSKIYFHTPLSLFLEKLTTAGFGQNLTMQWINLLLCFLDW